MFRRSCFLLLCVIVALLLSHTEAATPITTTRENGPLQWNNSTRALLQKREFYVGYDFYTGTFSRDVWSAALLSDNAYVDNLPDLKGM